jgi:GDP-4-dehydro-6-deoxy-D-mannose reductase
MSRRILVTGAAGFVGSWFIEHALAQGDDVVAAIRLRSNTENLDHIVPNQKLHLAHCELTDPTSVSALLGDNGPFTHIIHLAAQSFVRASWDQPHYTLTNNIQSQANLLEEVLKDALEGIETRVLIIGSSEEYGLVHEKELPITEEQPLRPLSPYAVSKIAQDLQGFQYNRSYGLPIVRARAFNHEGRRRGEHFVTSNFARQVARAAAQIKAGTKDAPIIHVGDLTTRRDYTDVRDIVRGYYGLLMRGTPGEVYNLCSGLDWSIGDVLDKLLELAGLTRDQADIRLDQSRLRPSDVPVLRGSYDKINKELGWAPSIPFETTLQDMLEEAHDKVRR